MDTDTRWLCGKCNTFNEKGEECEVCSKTTERWEIAYIGNTGLMEVCNEKNQKAWPSLSNTATGGNNSVQNIKRCY